MAVLLLFGFSKKPPHHFGLLHTYEVAADHRTKLHQSDGQTDAFGFVLHRRYVNVDVRPQKKFTRISPMRIVGLIALCCVLCLSRAVVASDPDTSAIVKQVFDAVGGEDKLLRLFRTRETVNVSADPEKKAPERISVYEPPKYWWTGKTERVKNEAIPDEPATFLVWAWTLVILTDPASKLESIPDVVESSNPAIGLRVSSTVTPPMDLYFDKAESRLVRIDWRSDIHRFSDWKELDGVKYPAKCVGFKKSSGKPWYFSEIIEIERLKDLPEGMNRR